MATDEQMCPRFRARRLRVIKQRINQIPDSAVAKLENYVLGLLPDVDDDDDPAIREAAKEYDAEQALMNVPMVTEREQ